jgi:hypothetical protein
MNTHSQILVISRDQMLLHAHRLILGTYFEVEAAGRMSEASSLLSKFDFDLIVLCDTLSEGECHQIADLVRDRRPQPTLISMLGPGNKNAGATVGRKLAGGVPVILLKECAEVLGYNLHGKQRMFSSVLPN